MPSRSATNSSRGSASASPPRGQDEIGSGLGLSIVRRIAALHGLDLRFERRDGGRGLRVRVGA